MKNRLITATLSLILLLPLNALAVEDSYTEFQPPVEVQQEDVVEGLMQTLDEDNQELAAEEKDNVSDTQPLSSPYKKPFGKRQLIKMFLKAMLGVGISCLLIYIMLTIYNTLRYGSISRGKNSESEPTLDAPDDIESAVKIFLEKTNWR